MTNSALRATFLPPMAAKAPGILVVLGTFLAISLVTSLEDLAPEGKLGRHKEDWI